MKRFLPWGILVVAVVAFTLTLRGQPEQLSTAIAQTPEEATLTGEAAPEAVAGEEKIVYTFEDDEALRQFTDLWQQRQSIILRMTVLQAYWNEEQAALAELNNVLTSQYHTDATKNYVLDGDRRVLIEREVPAAPALPTPPTEPITP